MTVLRIIGPRFDVDAFIADGRLRPCATWRVGEPVRAWRPTGERCESAGANIVVCDAGTIEEQAPAITAFLARHADVLAGARERWHADELFLDVHLHRPRQRLTSKVCYPVALLAALAALGIDLVVSMYPAAASCENADLGLITLDDAHRPVIRDTRVPAREVAAMLADDVAPETIVSRLPGLTIADVLAVAATVMHRAEALPRALLERA